MNRHFRIFIVLSLYLALPLIALHAQEKSPKTKTQADPIEESWLKELQDADTTQPAEKTTTNNSATGNEAGEPTQADTSQQSSLFAEDAAPSFVGLLFRFLLIVGLMGGTLYLFVRFFKKKAGIVGLQGGPIEVLASVPLMPGKFLQIVDLAGQLLVLGVSEQGVRLVYEIDSATTAEKIRLWHESRPKMSATGLLDVFQRAIRQGEFRFWGGERTRDRPDFTQLLRGEESQADIPPDRLKELLEMQNRKIKRSTYPSRQNQDLTE